MTSTPTTVDLDTELSAVNAILGSIGQAPVASLGTASGSNSPAMFDNPEIAFTADSSVSMSTVEGVEVIVKFNE